MPLRLAKGIANLKSWRDTVNIVTTKAERHVFMMKKTLVALALAATAVSGSVIAAGWTPSGTGGEVTFSGTLTPAAHVTPWEVFTGGPVDNLNASIKTGSKNAEVDVNNSIVVLGIRTSSKEAFPGAAGIDPQIDYKGAIDTAKFDKGVTTATLKIKNADGEDIGQLDMPLSAAAIISYSVYAAKKSLYADDNSDAFFGGVSSTREGVIQTESDAEALLNRLSPEIVANFNNQGAPEKDSTDVSFNHDGYKFSGAYGAGVVENSKIKLTLNAPAESGKEIAWKASMPIVVSYE